MANVTVPLSKPMGTMAYVIKINFYFIIHDKIESDLLRLTNISYNITDYNYAFYRY